MGRARAARYPCRPSNAGLRQYTDKDGETVTANGFWPALVTEDQWRSVVALFDSRRRVNASRTYLLSGLIDCVCGGKFAGTRRKNPLAGGGVVVRSMYRCMQCQNVSMQVEVVDAEVERATIERLRHDDFAELLGAARESAARTAAEKVQALRDRKNDAARSYARELIDMEQLEEITAELNPLLRVAEAEADRLTSGRTAVLDGLTGADPQTRWDDLGADRKRAVIALLWEITILRRDETHWSPEDRLIVVRKGSARFA